MEFFRQARKRFYGTQMTKRTSRTDSVSKLKKLWGSYYSKNSYLKSVSIQGQKGLRGIKESTMELSFPVSVICGANGAGKTTFMALSTLAFHANNKPLVPLKNIDYFDFNYFFKTTPKEKHDAGITIRWGYTDGTADTITKGSQRWMRYIRNNGNPKRPSRGTEFIGISRIIPAFEKKNYSNYFSKQGKFKEQKHHEELTRYLTKIISKKYTAVSELNHQNSAGTHSVNQYNSTHTSFNAGAGEECLTHILNTLLNAPIDSFIAIEEIEIGLHPSTITKLIDAILEIACKRKLQILITSHSTEFLRNFPSEGLILAERDDSRVEFISRPNVEYVITRLGGDHKTTCHIVCEDETAGKIIKNALSSKNRKICQVVAYGGKDELIEKAKTVHQLHPKVPIVIVWDGAAEDKLIENSSANGFTGIKLPSDLEPEDYIFTKLKTSEGKAFLEQNYSLSSQEINVLLDELECLEDRHDLFYTIAKQTGDTESEPSIRNDLTSFAAKDFKSEFDALRACIEEITGMK